MRIGLGQTCGAAQDPTYPTGCPAGFTLQQMFYVPNSEVTNVTASTPGAVPLLSAGCPQYICQNAQLQSPGQIASNAHFSSCNTEALIILAAGIAGLIFLPGWTKILSLAALPASFLVGLCGQSL